jgi:monooxygenase
LQLLAHLVFQGYSFSPWLDTSSLAPGGLILSYIKSTVEKYKISKHIQLGTKVLKMSWDSTTCLWTLTCLQSGRPTTFTCRFVFGCTGYYNYSHGYEPTFPGTENYKGALVHPQKWPESLDYSGKKVVVIGSGATAVTIVPEMAKIASHVTMLQRSPTFISSTPSTDAVGAFLINILPPSWSHWLNRWLHILQGTFIFSFCRTFPELVRRAVLKEAKKFIGEKSDCDINTHFNPSYKPWDERFCLVPDGDFFRAIGSGKASVRTADIVTFTESGIEIQNKKDQSKEILEADIVVTATGLSVQVLGGIEVIVDGESVMDVMSQRFSYKGIMVSGVPNFALSVGYTNLTFTLKADLIGIYVTRVLRYMAQKGYKKCVPVYGKRSDEKDKSYRGEDLISLSSGYIRRSIHLFPRQGKRSPWRYYNNYFQDMMEFYFGRVEDGVMEYS